MTQPPQPPTSGPADGETFDPDRDRERIDRQRQRTWNVLRDHQWHVPDEFEEAVGDSWASVSARVRDFRKPKFGGHIVESECVRQGLWRYRLLPEAEAGQARQRARQLFEKRFGPPVVPPPGVDH